MLVNSDTANKIAKNIDLVISRLQKKETDGLTYTCLQDEIPLIPDYSFADTQKKLRELTLERAHIRHCIAMFNMTTPVEVSGQTMMVDEALARMEFLIRRKKKLDEMLALPEVQRTMPYGSKTPEFTRRNFDPDEVQAAYDAASSELIALQQAVNIANLTITFEI